MSTFAKHDLEYLKRTGRDPERIASEVQVLREGKKWTTILRAASVGDGVRAIAPKDTAQLYHLHDTAAAAGRLSAFIPASGSGTRLFQDLFRVYQEGLTDIDRLQLRANEGDAVAQRAARVLKNIQHLAIWNELGQLKCPPISVEQIFEALFRNNGTSLYKLPKGLISFHRYNNCVRTAFEEHVNEAIALTSDSNRVSRIHFTVGPLQKPLFEQKWREVRRELEEQHDGTILLDLSIQHPATDTVAIDPNGNLCRDSSGNILFRPGGHGALLQNLNQSGGDIVLIKNIDNAPRNEHLVDVVQIRKAMCGTLIRLEHQINRAMHELQKGDGVPEAIELIQREFGVEPPPTLSGKSLRQYAINQLNRPLRVCGVVRTSGEPGGGPFWVNVENFGPTLQIVENAQIDTEDSAQREILHESQYFNPVDMVCSLRNVDGKPFDLNHFVDPTSVILTEKTHAGSPVLVYEHPGLWNGAMARWNTVFVEIPRFVFNPVKSLEDLLTQGHTNGVK